MPILFHELRRGRVSLIIWSAAIAFMLSITVIIFPEMQTQMADVGDMFSDMGAFSDAFGMDQLDFGKFMDYFGIECSNTLGLGGAIFAAIIGAGALAKEEKDRTAEFLLTHPQSRARIITEKLLACFIQILILNAVIIASSSLFMLAIDVEVDIGKLALIFLSHILLQIEIVSVTFGISAFMKRGEIGLGLGLVFGMYFINILANLTEELEALKLITPYSFTDGAYILSEGALEIKYLIPGMATAALGILAAYAKYTKKDIN